jgi:hypothetical protein
MRHFRGQRRRPRTNQQRCNGNLQAGQQIRFQKARNGDAAALDQQVGQTRIMQRRQNRAGPEQPVHQGQADDLDADGARTLDRLHHETARTIGLQGGRIVWQPPFWINHNTRRIRAAAQSRTVRRDASCSAVPTPITTPSTSARIRCKCVKTVRAGYIAGIAGHGGHPPIQRLADLRHSHRPQITPRQRAIKRQGGALGIGPCAATGAGAPGTDGQNTLPDFWGNSHALHCCSPFCRSCRAPFGTGGQGQKITMPDMALG